MSRLYTLINVNLTIVPCYPVSTFIVNSVCTNMALYAICNAGHNFLADERGTIIKFCSFLYMITTKSLIHMALLSSAKNMN